MVQVKVAQGTLNGEVLDLITNEGKYYSFKGIPYATPPVGKLRFKAPRAPHPWKGVREAKHHGPICPQYDMFRMKVLEGKEDCLYLNVYSPEIKPKNLLPVMFWIYGGAFICGSGNSDFYGPDFIVQQGVVLVTFNYRVGALGFLCLDTEEVPGNAGMKDQVAALRWVKENISNFGGNPDNVTIFGESAGGAAIGFHCISPMSRGLFKRAILQSGTCSNDWATCMEPGLRAYELGKKLGITTKDPNELLSLLQEVPAESFINVLPVTTLREKVIVGINLMWNVTKEKEFPGSDTFLGIDTDEYLKNIHDVDIMIGCVQKEGAVFIQNLEEQINIIDSFLEILVPVELALKCTLREQFEIGQKIKDYYFNGGPVTTKHDQELLRYYSASMFNIGIIRFLKNFKATRKSTAYLYSFACHSERNIMTTKMLCVNGIQGVTHSDDLAYLFDIVIADFPLNKSSSSYKMILNTTKLWTNFAKYGNPTPDDSLGAKWTPYSLEKEEYLEISEKLSPGFKLDAKDIAFWEQLYNKFYK